MHNMLGWNTLEDCSFLFNSFNNNDQQLLGATPKQFKSFFQD